MKILIITLYYLPEPLLLFSELAEGLYRLGHEVTVLTTFPNFPAGKIYKKYRKSWYRKENINNIKVIRIPSFVDRTTSSVYRILSYLSFSVSIFIFSLFFLPRQDIIYAIQPPSSGYAALIVAKLWRIPFVYEILDMWPESVRDSGMIKNECVLKIIEWFCIILYRNSTSLRVISKSQRENLVSKGISNEKIFLIPIWVDHNYYKPVKYDSEFAKNIDAFGYFNIVYAGNLGTAQGIDVILFAAKKIDFLQKIRFFIFGDGVHGNLLRQKAEELNIKNVKFMGSYPSAEMNKIFSIADAMILHLHDKPAFRMAIPHKILSYLACGKPIIAAVAGDVADIIIAENVGIVCDPDDIDKLADTIKKIYEMPKSKLYEFAENGRKTALLYFDKNVIISEINKMLLTR